MRIGIGGITHESLGSSPLMTRLQDFRVLRGQQIVDEPGYGLADVARRLEIELVPLLSATHVAPSGTVDEAAYLELRSELLERLRSAGRLDGICLLLHGAMLVENIWSGDTDQVREMRAVVGNAMPIAARLDLHANLNDEFANKTDIWTGFRTAPHRDMRETLERALTLLVSSIRSGDRPRAAFVRVPLLLQGEKATTDVEPMRSLMAMAREIEREPGILNAEVFVGFGWADSPHAGSSVAVIARDATYLAVARRHALRLAQAMWDRRHEFTFDQEVAESVDAAIDLALNASQSCVFVTDSGDNPTAGTPGDSTYFLSRLLERQVPDAILASIPDAEATRVCFEAGEGATVAVSLGGKWDRLVTGPLELKRHGRASARWRSDGGRFADGDAAGRGRAHHCHWHEKGHRLAGQLPRRRAGRPCAQACGGQAGLPDAGTARRGAARDPGAEPGLRRHAARAPAVPLRDASDLPAGPRLCLAGQCFNSQRRRHRSLTR